MVHTLKRGWEKVRSAVLPARRCYARRWDRRQLARASRLLVRRTDGPTWIQRISAAGSARRSLTLPGRGRARSGDSNDPTPLAGQTTLEDETIATSPSPLSAFGPYWVQPIVDVFHQAPTLRKCFGRIDRR